jgi:PEGA domain
VRYKTSSKVALVSVLLWPASLWSQMPSLGRLVISSEPAGATVTINGKQQSQRTNATFVVSAGKYTISVASADGRLKCSDTVTVSVGQVVARNCTAAGWKVQ